MTMTQSVSETATLQQRKPLKDAVSGVNGSNGAAHKAIPDESDSDNDTDVTQEEIEDGINDVDFLLSKSQVKGHRGHVHADEVDRSKVDPETRSYMEKVDKLIAIYEKPQDDIAWKIVTPSAVLFLGLIALAPFVLTRSLLISLPWLYVVGGLRVRLFIIFHDCGHGTFFQKFKDNMRIGKFLELLVATPFQLWLKRHNRHHRVQGNMDKLDLSSTIPITVNEYYSLPTWKRVFFRCIREPWVFFVIAPLLIWDLYYLILHGTKRMFASRFAMFVWFTFSVWIQTRDMTHSILAGLFWEQAVTYVPGLIGLVLFHLQHSANSGYRAPEAAFSPKHTALQGSTYLTVPWWFRWVTLNIEFHHIHHWSTRVPSYRLEECHIAGESMNLWQGITRIDTFKLFLDAIPNALWCEKRNRYVTFREL